MKNELTYKLFNQIIDYNPTTGKFTWKLRKNKTDKIKTKHDFLTGYPYLCVYGKYYTLHELAYLAIEKDFLGEEFKIVPKSKKISKYNLQYDNLIIRTKKSKDITIYTPTDIKGIFYCAEVKLWRVHIYVGGEKHVIGYYESFRQAVKVLWEINKKPIHGEAYDYLRKKGLIDYGNEEDF